MSLELNLSAKQLNVLVFQFNSLNEKPIENRDIKVARSILDKLVIRLRKKYIGIAHEPKYTKKGQIKKYKCSLEYHEAHYLERFVDVVGAFPMSEYDRNVLHLIKSTLNQQLA